MKAIFSDISSHIFYLIAAYGVAFIILAVLWSVSWYQLKDVRQKYAQLMLK